MRNSHLKFKYIIFLSIGLWQIFPLYAADIYKNVDSSGRVTYSDRPENVTSEKIKGIGIAAPGATKQKSPTLPIAGDNTVINDASDLSATGAVPIEVVPKSNISPSSSKNTLSAGSRSGVSGGAASSGSASPGSGGTSSVSTAGAAVKASPTSSSPTSSSPTSSSPTSSSPTPDSADIIRYKKWNPGHYVLVYPQGAESDEQHREYLKAVFSEITNNPGFKGIQKQYYWNKLEPSKGYYDFSEIKRDLAELRKINKRLIVTLQERSFITKEKNVPSYLLTSEYEGGVYPINNNNGFNAAYYNEGVQDRLVRLVREMGRQLDEYPNLEAFNLEETSHSMSADLWKMALSKRYYEGVVKLALAAEKAFPTTVVIQYVNYADSYLESIFGTMLNAGVGVGGPDVYENNPHLAGASYSYFPGVAGLIPIGMAVDYHNYQSSISGTAPIDPPSVQSIYKFAKDKLHANYIFWLRRNGDGKVGNYYKNVVEYFKSIDWKKDPAGGLNAQCPAMFNACLSAE